MKKPFYYLLPQNEGLICIAFRDAEDVEVVEKVNGVVVTGQLDNYVGLINLLRHYGLLHYLFDEGYLK